MKIIKLRRPLRRLGLVAALAIALGAGTAAPALAHTRLVSSTPGKGATAGPVEEVKLVFSDEIRVAKVVVKDAGGKTYQAGAAERDGTTVTQRLTGALPAGSYSVAWRVVGEDGHPIEGDGLTFTATAAPGASPTATTGAGAQQPAATAQPTKADEDQAKGKNKDKNKDDSGSGTVLWVLIVGGVLVGIAIGLGIVYRAKRGHTAAGTGE